MAYLADQKKSNTEYKVLSAAEIRRRLGPISPIQFEIWRQMTPAQL